MGAYVPGTNPAAHGNYRGRTGIDLAVLTLSYLPAAPDGYEYRAWASHGGRWTLLGHVVYGAIVGGFAAGLS